MLDSEDWVGEECWLMAADHVYVGGLDVVRIEEAHYAGDHYGPVAALINCIPNHN